MCKDNKMTEKCHCIIDLNTVGLQGTGCIADIEWINSIIVPCHISDKDPLCLYSQPDKNIYTLEPISSGNYGHIDGGLREIQGKQYLIIIKKPRNKGRVLLQEALVQKIVYKSLKRGGFPKGAPNVYDIFSLHDTSVCFTMDIIYGYNLQHYIDITIGNHLINTLIETLFHISSMMWHLETDIGMNHRDLKPSNIILQFHEHCTKIRTVGKSTVVIHSKFDITFVDFGFSCIGLNSLENSVKMSESYDKDDPCPKEGRDMYMFLCFIYFYTHKKLPMDLDKLFQNWLNVESCIMTDILKSPKTLKDTEDILTLIYCVTGAPEVTRLQSTPERIFYDLQMYRKH